MLQIPYEYGSRKFYLTPYKTEQERDLLLLSMIDDETFDSALKICGIGDETINNLTDDEKVGLLYKFRSISVGEEINVNFKCVHCKTSSDNVVDISNIVIVQSNDDERIIDQHKRVTDDNLEEFINVSTDEMDLDEFETLLMTVKNNVTKFEFEKEIVCQKCKKINVINIDKQKFVIDNMSDDTLNSLYQTYNDLNFYGNYSKLDIDSLYPFERTIFMSLLNKSKGDLNS